MTSRCRTTWSPSIFYNKDLSKAYITSLGNGALHVMDMTHVPYRPKKVDMPDCKVAEDVAFSKDNKTWYMTCMGSSNVIVGDAKTDKQIKVIAADSDNAFIRYPHGISINEDIDRIIVTSTVRPSDLGDAGETVRLSKLPAEKCYPAINCPINPLLPVCTPLRRFSCPNRIRRWLISTPCLAARCGPAHGMRATRTSISSRCSILMRLNRACRWKSTSMTSMTACTSPQRIPVISISSTSASPRRSRHC